MPHKKVGIKTGRWMIHVLYLCSMARICETFFLMVPLKYDKKICSLRMREHMGNNAIPVSDVETRAGTYALVFAVRLCM